MIDISALVQVKAFARQDAVALSVLWTASLAAYALSPSSSWGSLLALCTPFLVGWLLTRFRETALDGVISFRRGLAYCCYVFFYASLIFALVQYIYFRFLDGGRFAQMIDASLKVLEPFYQQQGISTKELETGSKIISMMSPIQLAFTFMMQNLFVGFLLSLPIALICQRRTKRQGAGDKQRHTRD
jgi:hypothetical protein